MTFFRRRSLLKRVVTEIKCVCVCVLLPEASQPRHVYLVSELKLNTTNSLSTEKVPAAGPPIAVHENAGRADKLIPELVTIHMFKFCTDWKNLASVLLTCNV